MRIFVIVMLMIMLAYTVINAISLWKEKNKLGAIAVFFLAAAIVIIPFFSVLKE